MKAGPTCPRCGSDVRSPNVWSSAWRCQLHGEVYPLAPPVTPSRERLQNLLRGSRVPFWLPWPLPTGWLATGVTYAGDERSGVHASAVACSGPNLTGGVAELILVAEEPGVGLGARYAGLAGPDPGDRVGASAPHAKIHAAGHPTSLWCVTEVSERAVYVGEGLGMWLWAVFWPDTAGYLMLDELILADLRDAGHEFDGLPVGAPSPRLSAPA